MKPSNDIPIHFSLKIKYNFFNLAEKLNRSFCKTNYANKCAQRCNWYRTTKHWTYRTVCIFSKFIVWISTAREWIVLRWNWTFGENFLKHIGNVFVGYLIDEPNKSQSFTQTKMQCILLHSINLRKYALHHILNSTLYRIGPLKF